MKQAAKDLRAPRLRLRAPSGDDPGLGWLRVWLGRLSAAEDLRVQAPPLLRDVLPGADDAADGGGAATAEAPDIDLWPGTVRGDLDGVQARCEWAIVDPEGRHVLEAARTLRRFSGVKGWELLLLERESPAHPWCLRRRAHVACPPRREPALTALTDAAVRLVRQGALDRSLGLPAPEVPAEFAARLGQRQPRPAAGWWQEVKAGWRDWYQCQRRRLTSEHWCIGVIDAPIHRVLGDSLLEVHWITQPRAEGYWADPFGLPGDPTRLAAEYFDERTGQGHLETLTLDTDGSIRFRERIGAGEGRHASFPTQFEMDGQCWGLAETAATGQVVLHRIDERGEWTPAHLLLDGVRAADPVLFKVDGRYWLAYTDIEIGAMDNLCLAWSDTLHGPFTPHANNPVKVDISGARMAGRPFLHQGHWYRPAQDCLDRYGAAIVVHRIEHLSPVRFEERVVRRIEAARGAHLPHGMHTLSAWGERTLVDAKIERMNLVSWTRKVRDRLGGSARAARQRSLHDDRVFIYLPHLRTGGGEISMLRVAEGLAERGLEVELVVHDAASRELPLPRGVTLIDLQAQGTAQALRKLSQRIRKRQPRYVISAFPHTNVATVTAVKMARSGAMSIVTEHAPLTHQIDQQNNWRYRMLPWLVRSAYRRADAIVAVSSGVRDDLKPIVGRSVRIHTIHNPVLPDNYETAALRVPQHPWLVDPQLQVVMSLCRLSDEKDLGTLVRAFARLRESHPQARLLMVGDGPQREALQVQVQAAGLADVAALPGRTDEPLAWLSRAAVFVLSSRFEGYGNVLVEALAVGTPVVSTDCPVGPREILEGGRYGDLVPVGDDAAMARAISRNLTARRVPDGARAAARKRTQARTCDDYLALLNHLDLTRG
jgi:glycosyltransferase involved in cell wall biosynthesis